MKIKLITLLFLPLSILAMQLSIDYNEQLLKAAMSGDLDALKSAIANGANVESPWSERQLKSLSIAASQGQVPLLEVLLKASANIEAKDINQNTPLSYAARHGNVPAIEALLKAGAIVEVINHGQFTPLHAAVLNGFVPATEVLLKAGAHSNTPYRGRPLLNYIIAGNINNKDIIIRQLLEYGITITDYQSNYIRQLLNLNKVITCLITYTLLNQHQNIETMLKFNHSNEVINDVDNNGKTALMWAALRGSNEIVKNLLAYDTHDKNLATNALILAKERNNKEAAAAIYNYLEKTRFQYANEMEFINLLLPIRLLITKYLFGDIE